MFVLVLDYVCLLYQLFVFDTTSLSLLKSPYLNLPETHCYPPNLLEIKLDEDPLLLTPLPISSKHLSLFDFICPCMCLYFQESMKKLICFLQEIWRNINQASGVTQERSYWSRHLCLYRDTLWNLIGLINSLRHGRVTMPWWQSFVISTIFIIIL